MLNPAQYFKPLLDECRSVIIAGGTMKPSTTLINQLLATTSNNNQSDNENDSNNQSQHENGSNNQSEHRKRFVEFSCGHVVDASKQLLPVTLSNGPSGQLFEFSYEKQKDVKQIEQLGRLIINVNQLIKGGIVCFFPSYKLSKFVYDKWKTSGILERIEKKKKVFCDTQNDASGQTEGILSKYSKFIENCKKSTSPHNGALLLSVVGGRMSEGINFSDDLGRCVLMIGLPYPNIKSVELQQKMKFMDQNLPHLNGMKPSAVFYEELCMKAVNQSIGRAIRHKNDYACVLLVDRRYLKRSVQSKLPEWISAHINHSNDNFPACFSSIRKFFKDKETSK